jgi:uncharacterized membrane protein YkvA (DUF1232 family)
MAKKNKALNWVILLVAGLYLLNLTFGFDIIPDNIPLAGNIDEVIASILGYNAFRKVKKGK